ncbi:hypothetical protein ACHAW6_011042 [Cyclotella cf. meneghiniana]
MFIRLPSTLLVLLTLLTHSLRTTTAHSKQAAVLRGRERTLQEDPNAELEAEGQNSTSSVELTAAPSPSSSIKDTAENFTVATITNESPPPDDTVVSLSPTASPVENETFTEIGDAPESTIATIAASWSSSTATTFTSPAADDNSTLSNETAVSTSSTTPSTTSEAAASNPASTTITRPTWVETERNDTDDDDAGNYSYGGFDDDANDDYDNKWDDPSPNDRSPTPPPTPRPTYEYSSSQDDMLTQTEMNAGNFHDDYVGSATLHDKVASYLEGVESASEMERDKNVRIVAGVLTVVFVGLWLITAQQTMENPDGLCASVCRLTLKFLSCLGRILFLPCRYLCCKGSSAEQARSRRSHAPMRAPFPSDLELS